MKPLNRLSVVILAAGQGTRMRSLLPKGLHPIGGMPLLTRIVSTVNALNPDQIIIVHGFQGEQLKAAFAQQNNIIWVEQTEQKGTGHAVLQALPVITENARVLILYGDIPLITHETLQALLATTDPSALGLITIDIENPTGFGRIVRDEQGALTHIVEEKDATEKQKNIKEINTGFFVVPKEYLSHWLPTLTTKNQQREYYLTDIIDKAVLQKTAINTLSPQYEWEVLGVNDKVQLADLERTLQKTNATKLMLQGVTLCDPNRFDLRGELIVGQDVTFDVNVILEGKNQIGNNVRIGPNVMLKNVVIEEGATILANCVIEEVKIGKNCIVGPFARVRPGTELGESVHVGNFVELKNAKVGRKSKINHLSYVGDALLGQEVNIGAGTITCNYDGVQKHTTTIEDGAFIGSNTQLIAPVTIGAGATVGAGTTVVKDVPAHYLIHNQIQHRSVAKKSKESK